MLELKCYLERAGLGVVLVWWLFFVVLVWFFLFTFSLSHGIDTIPLSLQCGGSVSVTEVKFCQLEFLFPLHKFSLQILPSLLVTRVKTCFGQVKIKRSHFSGMPQWML